jgi:DNA mismatch repair protein MLH1
LDFTNYRGQVGSASPELSSPASSSTPKAIQLLYGNSIAKNLLQVSVSPLDNSKSKKSDKEKSSDTNDEPWSAIAHFTNANYQAKKMVFLLFINSERWYLVISSPESDSIDVKIAWWSQPA